MHRLELKYIGHSGFLCDTGKRFLLFDLFEDKHGLLDGGLPHEGDGAVFVSHSHRDHFNPGVFGLGVPGRTTYVVDSGVDAPGSSCETRKVSPGQALDAGPVRIKVFGSTDEGSSFFVETDGWSVFHSGDLNDWYWKEESTREELLRDEDLYMKELGRIRANSIDVAFVPVDLRLGAYAARGARHFAKTVRPGCIVPMHMNGRLDPHLFEEALRFEGSCSIPLIMEEGGRTELRKE